MWVLQSSNLRYSVLLGPLLYGPAVGVLRSGRASSTPVFYGILCSSALSYMVLRWASSDLGAALQLRILRGLRLPKPLLYDLAVGVLGSGRALQIILTRKSFLGPGVLGPGRALQLRRFFNSCEDA